MCNNTSALPWTKHTPEEEDRIFTAAGDVLAMAS